MPLYPLARGARTLTVTVALVAWTFARPSVGSAAPAPTAPPVISRFAAAPDAVAKGKRAVLSWTVSGAPGLRISPSPGAVTGTSASVSPTATTTYTLTATNARGTATARVTVRVGPPVVESFLAAPASIRAGTLTTLSWAVSGASQVTLAGVGNVAARSSAPVRPAVTTTYRLTASNAAGSASVSITVSVGLPPVIGTFAASPSTIAPGAASTLAWSVGSATMVNLSPAPGAVTGTSLHVSPAHTTTYRLTASNAHGSSTATAVVTVGILPTIEAFWPMPATAGPGAPATLRWVTRNATSLSIDHGVGPVTGTSTAVSPGAATVYTLTASNAVGSVSATASVKYMPLVTVREGLFYSEHCVFVVPDAAQVTWNSWSSVYAFANLSSYVDTLKTLFPADYFFVTIAANNLSPANVPNVLTWRHHADGIGQGSITGTGVPNMSRYHLGTGTVGPGAFAVLDHEIGHNWGVTIGSEVGTGHWKWNSTATGQMAATYSDDGYLTVKQVEGDPVSGFTWRTVDNLARNETDVYSEQDLYLQGLAPAFPPLHVLDSPVFNADHTVSHSGVTTYDQAWVEARNGVRSPGYRTSPKSFRLGFVYVARDVAEVLAVYQPIEASIVHFTTSEAIDRGAFRFQVPFLVATGFRGSVDARLADLDGNATPSVTVSGSSAIVAPGGSASVSIVAADADGPSPAVSCVPASDRCSVAGGVVSVNGLAPGTHFVTVKAEDAGGKKAFTHFVVDVP